MATTDLSEILPEEIEAEVKLAAEISMGTEVSEQDIGNIRHLCDQVQVARKSASAIESGCDDDADSRLHPETFGVGQSLPPLNSRRSTRRPLAGPCACVSVTRICCFPSGHRDLRVPRSAL